MKNACTFYIAFQNLEVVYMKIKTQQDTVPKTTNTIQPPFFYLLLFLLAFTPVDIIFPQIFRTSFNII